MPSLIDLDPSSDGTIATGPAAVLACLALRAAGLQLSSPLNSAYRSR